MILRGDCRERMAEARLAAAKAPPATLEDF